MPESKNAKARWEDDDDDTLREEDLIYFKKRLEEERERVKVNLQRHLAEAIGDAQAVPDELDQAGRISDQAYMMRLSDKEGKLLGEIERALAKFKNGDYGYCEGTGDPISRQRLDIRPWTRYSIEYKEQLEREKGARHR